MPSQFRLTFRPSIGRERSSEREHASEGYDGEDLPTPTFLEFFAGAGIVRQGLLPTWRCLWANDIDPSKERIYTANFGKDEFHRRDVAEVEASSLPAADMAWTSFPCQDLSLAGWQRGMSAGRSGTFWAFWRLMRDLYDVERIVGPLLILS
jgi:DNA (cytosine-5)-methyltransferase 1